MRERQYNFITQERSMSIYTYTFTIKKKRKKKNTNLPLTKQLIILFKKKFDEGGCNHRGLI